jgi:hypothetical protein
MPQDLESILRKSLDDVDRSQKWQIAGLAIFLVLFVLHAYGFVSIIHGGGGEASIVTRRTVFMGIVSVIFTLGCCTFAITLSISRMTKRLLKAIELSSKT